MLGARARAYLEFKDESPAQVDASDLTLVKAVLIGDQASGKSALLNGLAGGALSSQYQPSQGVDFRVFTNNTYKLQVWDTTGNPSELYRNTTRAYYRGVKIAIFTWDGNPDAEDFAAQRAFLAKEKEELDRVGAADVIRILVVTKNDLQREVSEEQIEALKKDLGIVEAVFVSAKDKASLERLNQFLFEKLHQADLKAGKTRAQLGLERRIERRIDADEGAQERLVPQQHPVSLELQRFAAAKVKFEQAKNLISDASPVLQNPRTQANGRLFRDLLGQVHARTFEDYDSNTLEIDEVETVAENTLQLATQVAAANNPNALLTQIDTFHKQTLPPQKPHLLGRLLGGLLGAAVGVVAGLLIGALIGSLGGPYGAGLTALYLGYKGAIAGACVGAAVGGAALGAAGYWCSLWLTRRDHPIKHLENKAREIQARLPQPS